MTKVQVVSLILLHFYGTELMITRQNMFKAFSEAVNLATVSEQSNDVVLLGDPAVFDELSQTFSKSSLATIQLLLPNSSFQSTGSIVAACLHNSNELDHFPGALKRIALRGTKILLMLLESQAESSHFSNFFKEFSSSHAIVDINILTAMANEIVMVTFYPFHHDECRSSRPVTINVYNATMKKWKNEEIFPRKLRDFHNCPLRVSTLEYPPAVMRKIENGEEKFYGCDVEVIQGLSSTMNFHVNYSFVAGLYNFGEVYGDNNSTGAISHVFKGEADIVIGFYFLTYDRLKYLTHSTP